MVTAVVVANTFIVKSLEEKINITPMKLQKLIYFLYKEYLKTTGEKLFSEPFEAWQYGPVLASVYDEFKCFGAKPIDRFARDSIGDVYVVNGTKAFERCFETVWEKYKSYDGWNLSLLTHQGESAWRKATNSNSYFLLDEDIKNES